MYNSPYCSIRVDFPNFGEVSIQIRMETKMTSENFVKDLGG